MEEEILEQLEAAGNDVEMALYRFLDDEDLYMDFLVEFLDDESYSGLMDAVPAGDWKRAFECAHTLKGVAANLGLNPIRESADTITELLRGRAADGIDTEVLSEQIKRLEERHEQLRHMIGR